MSDEKESAAPAADESAKAPEKETAGKPAETSKSTLQLFLTWTLTDIVWTFIFLGWTACVCYAISPAHYGVSILVGLGVAVNYSLLAIYHVNSVSLAGGERVKNVALIFLAPSVIMALLALMVLLRN